MNDSIYRLCVLTYRIDKLHFTVKEVILTQHN